MPVAYIDKSSFQNLAHGAQLSRNLYERWSEASYKFFYLALDNASFDLEVSQVWIERLQDCPTFYEGRAFQRAGAVPAVSMAFQYWHKTSIQNIFLYLSHDYPQVRNATTSQDPKMCLSQAPPDNSAKKSGSGSYESSSQGSWSGSAELVLCGPLKVWGNSDLFIRSLKKGNSQVSPSDLADTPPCR